MSIRRNFKVHSLDTLEDPFYIKRSKEIFARDKFVDSVHIEISEFDSILAPYDLAKTDYVHCGLNGCTREHGKGFLFRLKDGRESICGKDCGSREFKADFDPFTKQFYDRVAEANRRKVILQAKTEAAPLLLEAKALLVEATKYNQLVSQIMDDCIKRDDSVYRQFLDIVNARGAVYKEERVNGDWVETESKRSEYRRTLISQLYGYDVYFDKGRAQRNLSSQVIPTLEEITALDTTSIRFGGAPEGLTIRIADCRRNLQDAALFVRNAEVFSRVDNLKALCTIWTVMPKRVNRANRALHALERIINDRENQAA